MDAAVGYLARLGRSFATEQVPAADGELREDLSRGMRAILSYERILSAEMLRVLGAYKAQVHGIADPTRVAGRVPTFSFNLGNLAPSELTLGMARAGIGIRDGHLYCPRLMGRLGLPLESGMVRVSLVHYNTIAEIHRFGDVLSELTGQRT
jgi:selenocysteine lyase/cysteine desulfurase